MNSDFRVGPWTVRPSLNTLSQNGTSNRVEPKVMQVLVCLASHPNSAVTKEEILKAVWPDTFVSDDALVRSISELRRVFKDDAREPSFIETIPKCGYRLLAPVTPTNGNVGDVKAEANGPSKPLKKKWRFTWATIPAMILACGALAGFNIIDLRARLFHRNPPIRSLAVLPLKNLSGDPSQSYFASGMTEELITDLSEISALRIVSRTSSEAYEGTRKSLPEIAHELNVEGIIEGSVERSGNRVRITAQLIYAPEDKNLWGRSYDRDMQDALAVQSTIASTIADEIRVQVSPNEQARLRMSRPVNVTALKYYLEGNYFLHRVAHGSVDDQSRKAEEDFQRAIDLDPDFVPAYLGLAETHMSLLIASPTDYELMKAAVLKALALDPDSSEAHDLMAYIDLDDWKWSQAETEYRRAVALNPNRAEAHAKFSWFLFGMGHGEEGETEAQLAQALDPNVDHISGTLTNLGRYDEDRQLLLRDIERQPDHGQAHFDLFENYALTDRYAEAIEQLVQAAKLFGLDEATSGVEHTFSKAGFRPAISVAAENIEKMQVAGKLYMPGALAEFYTLAGNNDRAFYWLDYLARHKHWDGADGGLVWLKGNPSYAPLRSDARYTQLLKQVGLPPG